MNETDNTKTTVHSFLKKILEDFYLFISRGEWREEEGEKHQYVVASCTPLTRDLDCNPGISPEWESSQRPFSLQVGAQSTEPHPAGRFVYFFFTFFHYHLTHYTALPSAITILLSMFSFFAQSLHPLSSTHLSCHSALYP